MKKRYYYDNVEGFDFDDLTFAEKQAISLNLHELDQKDIAALLFIKEGTMAKRFKLIFTKVRVKKSKGLAIWTMLTKQFDFEGNFQGQYLFNDTPKKKYVNLPWQ